MMKKLLADSSLSISKQMHLNFALAKVFENLTDFDQAFNYYKRANSLKAEKYPFNLNRHTDFIERIKNVFNAQFFSQRRDYGISDKRLIFIVGMPCSGSTLVEQILASHPSVDALGEHLALPAIVKKLPGFLDCSQPLPECATKITSGKSRQLANQYLQYTDTDFTDKQITTDKMLGNFLRLGLIALLFPNSRVIHCQRDPMDTCLSCYTQDFAHGLRFSTSLNHLGFFYNFYADLMRHWHDVLPLDRIDIQYEQLVLNKQDTIRQLLAFCDLSWDSRCLDFYKTKRVVSTASFWQVKQPLYTDSIVRWKQYENYLDPLVKALRLPGQEIRL